VLRADAAGMVLEWRAPAFSLRQMIGGDGRAYVALDAPGWAWTDMPGQPQLPLASALAVVPPAGDVTLRVQVLESARYPTPCPVVPALRPVPVGDPPTGVEGAWAWDERAYAQAAPHSQPSSLRGKREIVTLEEAGWLRGRRLVRLTFHPLRFDPAGPALEVAHRVRVELRFDGADFPRCRPDKVESLPHGDSFTSILQHAVVNPTQVTQFVRPERVAAAQLAPGGLHSAPNDGSRYKLIISREGAYELTRDALMAAGVPVTTTAYRLEHAGEEVAYQWEGDSDDVFDPKERILFYARPSFTRFADYDVYWLTVGVTGPQMTVRTGDPAGLPSAVPWATAVAEHNEGEQNYLSRYSSGWDDDHWYWDRLYLDCKTGTGEWDKNFSVTLATPDSGAPNATLRVYLQGTTYSASINPDHRAQVWLNSNYLGTTEWDGNVYHIATFSPSADLLQAGSNTVRLRLPGNGATSGIEEMWLDAIELRHGVSAVSDDPIRVEGISGRNAYTLTGFTSDSVRIYDVTSPTTTQVVTGFTVSSGTVTFGDADDGTATYYLLTEEQIAPPDEILPALTLPDPPAGADYLIIAHSDFITTVAPLAAHRALSDGLRVFSTTVEAVYDVYGDGRVHPEAIKSYIAHAYHDWKPPTLSYVLLVGDGTYDPLNHYQSPDHRPTFVPPYLLMADPWWGEAASDNRFVTMDGPDDQLADVFIGRLPVNSVTETRIVVEKILTYERDPLQWPWNQRVLLFADDPEPGAPFHQDSDEVYATLPISFTGQRVYYCTSDCNQSHLYEDVTDAHDAVMRELNVGGLLVSYVGHSSWHQWAVERLFHLDDVTGLHNGWALPVFLELTCFTSYFSYPTTDTLDESLLRLAGGGAIATWGSTALVSTAGHRILHQGFFDAVFEDGIIGLGPATEVAKAKLDLSSQYSRDTFILLGDPAMKLNLTVVPWAHGVFLPLVLRAG